MNISNNKDIDTLSVVHIDQLIEQVRNILSEEEKELFSKEMVNIDQIYQQEIDSITFTTLQF